MAGSVFGCCLSAEEKDQRSKSKAIDKDIQKHKQQLRREVKVLLLGAGESGKSTFLKQMKIIHGQKFDDTDLKEFRTIIYGNIIKGMKVLADARSKLNIPWGDENCERYANTVLGYDSSRALEPAVFQQYVQPCKILWQDSGIQSAFDRKREFQLADSVRYFLDEIDRIGKRDYIPTESDILHSRKATKGISENVIEIKNVPFRFVDVGGQRSQRQKWFQCFENVTSILFLVSSSEFDQVLMEDRVTNRLFESCNIFDTIVNHRYFVEVSIILFLNKSDLLEEKVKRVSIKDYFPAYNLDPHDLSKVQSFILNMFDTRRRERSKALFHHFTTAVDTDNIKYVFTFVRDTILSENLRRLMLQ